MIRPVALVLVLALVLGACRQPQPEASPTPVPELAAEPDAIESEPTSEATNGTVTAPTPTPTSEPQDEGTRPQDDPGDPDPQATAPLEDEQPPPNEPREYNTMLTIDDRRGDEGLEAPSYADVRRITLQDDGERLRVWVDVGEDIPRALNEGEVIGLGIDLYLTDDDDSDYQLFADGGSDGWRAYFQTPRGFVAYPGTFGLGGRRIEFVVPWSSMGTPPRGEVRVFLDWAQARPVLNAAGSDYAPDSGRQRWSR